MKKILAAFAAILMASSAFAQVPQKLSYQAVVRDASNTLVKNQVIGVRISILQGSVTGSVVYTETQSPTSNANGLISIEIGQEPGFTTINWSNGPFFIRTEIDPAGGANYNAITGTSQLLSVPFALYSKTAENYQENDPVFSSHPSSGISFAAINNWNQAYTWGNHANAGYITSFTEVDPGLAGNFDFAGASNGDMLKFNGAKWMRFTPDFSSSSHSHQLANSSTDGFLSASEWNIFNSKENTLTFTGPLSRSGNTISIPFADNTSSGYLSNSDWNTFNSKENTLIFNGPLNRSGNTVTIPVANSITDGYLTSADWTIFNNKSTFNLPSLTAGSLLFSDGTTIAQDNSNLAWDNTNKRLAVKSINFTSDNFRYFALLNGNNFLYNNSGYIEMHNIYSIWSGNTDLTFYNQSKVVFNSGNVGIGVSAPSAKLHVNGVVKASGGNSDNWNAAYSWGDHAAAGYGTYTLPPLTAGSVLLSDGATITQDNSKLFWDNTNKRLGVGNSSPAFNLDVTGNSRITDQLVVKSINFTPSNFSYFGYVNGNNFLYNNSGNIEMMNIYSIYTNGGLPLNFYNQGKVVFNSGNVGIGVANPTQKLEVNGVVKANGGTSSDWNTAFSWGNHAVAGYQPLIAAGTSGQYLRGDKTWQTLDKAAVGLGAVENTAISTWTGSSNIVTLGTVSAGVWNAGAVTSSGTITGSSIVKTGGTSGQFLKADGSVDNNTYMTAIQEAGDEFTAAAGQTSFTLTQVPTPSSKVKMFINGIRISNTAYSNTGTSLTYNPVNNGSYTLTAGDRIQFDYSY